MSAGSGDMWKLDKDDLQVEAVEDDEWAYEHPLIPRFEPELKEIDEAQTAQDLAKLDRTLKRVHPKFQFVEEQSPDADMQALIQSLMPKTLRLNGPLTAVRPRPGYPGD